MVQLLHLGPCCTCHCALVKPHCRPIVAKQRIAASRPLPFDPLGKFRTKPTFAASTTSAEGGDEQYVTYARHPYRMFTHPPHLSTHSSPTHMQGPGVCRAPGEFLHH